MFDFRVSEVILLFKDIYHKYFFLKMVKVYLYSSFNENVIIFS